MCLTVPRESPQVPAPLPWAGTAALLVHLAGSLPPGLVGMEMPVFLWEARLLCLSSSSAALKLSGKEYTLFKDHSLAVFLWIL